MDEKIKNLQTMVREVLSALASVAIQGKDAYVVTQMQDMLVRISQQLNELKKFSVVEKDEQGNIKISMDAPGNGTSVSM